MFKTILIISLFISTIIITVALVRDQNKCPPQKILYRYIPKTFEQEQSEPVYVSDIFQTMFTQPSPWIGGINDLDTRKREVINKYFISQM